MPARDDRKDEWWRQKRWWIPVLLVVLGSLVLVIMGPPAVIRASRPDIQTASAADQLKAENDLRGTLVTMLAGLAVAGGTVVAALNFANSRAALEETQRQNRESSELQRRAQVTDRFSKAIDQLGQPGADKRDVRIGGIYALEQIARDTQKDDTGDLHWPVVEILTAFIRESAKSEVAQVRKEQTNRAQAGEPSSAADVHAALTVLGRRDSSRDLGRLDLHGVDLEGAYMLGALDLKDAVLSAANLKDTMLTEPNFEKAYLSGANLMDAMLLGANLKAAHLVSANLRGAILIDASLHGAQLPRADLRGAELGASSFHGADLADADLRGVDLSKTFGLAQEQLDSAICDDETKPPPGLTVHGGQAGLGDAAPH